MLLEKYAVTFFKKKFVDAVWINLFARKKGTFTSNESKSEMQWEIDLLASTKVIEAKRKRLRRLGRGAIDYRDQVTVNLNPRLVPTGMSCSRMRYRV